MTRINLVPPQELCDQHLVAEWRELPRIRHISWEWEGRLDEIPKEYCLGKGHCIFFADKGIFLSARHADIYREMKSRDMSPNPYLILSFLAFPDNCQKGYTPTEKALQLNRERIQARMPKNARFSN